MKSIFAKYDDSVVSLVSSVQKYFGIETNKKSLKEIDDILEEEQFKNIVLVLYDGFGYNILKRNRDVASFLNENLKRSISTVFPATTAAATTSVISGLNPVEHGWLGWDMYFKDYDKVMTLFLNVEKESKKKPGNWTITSNLLPYESVTNMVSKKEGCKGTIVSPFARVKYTTIDEMNDRIVEECNNNYKNYVYGYYANPDSLMHEFGTDATIVKNEMNKIDNAFRNLCERLDDSLIIMIADHGHINCDTITLSDHKEIFDMLKGTTGLDQRTCSFRVKDEYKEVFKEKLSELLKDDFIILSKEEVIEKQIFGTGKENKYYIDGIGDFIAIATNNKAIRYSENSEVLTSTHAGITEDEMLVPLVLVKKKRK